MGFSGLQTTLLTLPVGGVEIVAMVIAGFLSSYLKRGRTVIMFVVAAPTLAGISMLQALPQTDHWGRCAGVWLVLCVPASYAILLSIISSNVAGFSKKLMTTSMAFVSFCVGNIVSPQLFISSEAPGYRTGVRAMLVAITLCQVLSIALGCVTTTWNFDQRGLLKCSTDSTIIPKTNAAIGWCCLWGLQRFLPWLWRMRSFWIGQIEKTGSSSGMSGNQDLLRMQVTGRSMESRCDPLSSIQIKSV